MGYSIEFYLSLRFLSSLNKQNNIKLLSIKELKPRIKELLYQTCYCSFYCSFPQVKL